MAIVGLADKSVAGSKERVRAALSSLGLALPSNRIAINLSPVDVLTSLLPALDAREALEVTMLHSVAGQLKAGGLIQKCPFVNHIIQRPWQRRSVAAHGPSQEKFRGPCWGSVSR